MQHLHESAKVAIKQRVLEDNLWHLGKVKTETVLRPIQGPAWGYRYRARLSVRYVHKKGEVLIGFHERKSRYVADMQVCPVLRSHESEMLLPLRALIFGMDDRETCPKIELACSSPKVPSQCICSTKVVRRCPIHCPISASPCRFVRPISPRSIRTSTACWFRGRCDCSMSSATNG